MIKKFEIEDFNINITKNFIVKEFACHDETPYLYIDIDLVKKLQEVRDYINKPIKIICGYRTENYNNRCGGAIKSKHLTGEAIDFNFNGAEIMGQDIMSDKNIFYLACDLQYHFKFKRIGIYINRANNYIHIDNNEEPLIWVNDNKKQRYYNNLYDYLLYKQPVKEVVF